MLLCIPVCLHCALLQLLLLAQSWGGMGAHQHTPVTRFHEITPSRATAVTSDCVTVAIHRSTVVLAQATRQGQSIESCMSHSRVVIVAATFFTTRDSLLAVLCSLSYTGLAAM